MSDIAVVDFDSFFRNVFFFLLEHQSYWSDFGFHKKAQAVSDIFYNFDILVL